jgi:hypothetical protein
VVIRVVIVEVVMGAVGPEMAAVRKIFHPPLKAPVQDTRLGPLRLHRQAWMVLRFHQWTLPLSQV